MREEPAVPRDVRETVMDGSALRCFVGVLRDAAIEAEVAVKKRDRELFGIAKLL